MYGTSIRPNPAAKLPNPTPALRIKVGYCMAVYVGTTALLTPIIHFAIVFGLCVQIY